MQRFSAFVRVAAAVAVALAVSPASAAPPVPESFLSRLTRPLYLRDGAVTYLDDVASFFPVAGEEISFEVVAPAGAAPACKVRDLSGAAVGSWNGSRWRWTAPEAGFRPLLLESASGDVVRLQIFALHSAAAVRRGSLNGYRIGAYPAAAETRPRGYVEVDEGNAATPVSPHFTLGQFVCKAGGYPKYAAVSAPLVQALEYLWHRFGSEGIPVRRINVMSAYRTPEYNRAIGNATTLSRHTAGDAADIYVDNDGDGAMDDVNGDGRRDLADAVVLADVLERVHREGALAHLGFGGLGIYPPTHAHGAFVHIDMRGRPARWGPRAVAAGKRASGGYFSIDRVRVSP